ncbi:MAG: response regulator [Cyanobacteria bacterium P01_D01_bin.156]
MDIKELANLLELPSKQFEGHLILNDQRTTCTLHFFQGRLLYSADKLHPVRCWNRTIGEYFPNFHLNTDVAQLSQKPYWQLYLLDQGFREQQLSLVRAKLMLRAVVQECLFELSQRTHVTYQWQPAPLPISRLCSTIALSPWEIKMIINKVGDMRRSWQQLGLTVQSPKLSPVLKSTINNQRLPISQQYLNGEYTLWQIATKLSNPIDKVTKSLIPFIQNESLELKTIPDLPLTAVQLSPPPVSDIPEQTTAVTVPPAPAKISSSVISARPYELPSLRTTPVKLSAPELVPQTPKAIPVNRDKQPLIACIDDSPVLAHSLKKILSEGGYRTLIIQEPMQGFAQLIEHMPSLILLDVMLPNADGYNICRFLRDTPVFKKTPIIILTGRSKPVDRARASMAGATEFLVKPPEADALLQMVDKYLKATF